MKSTLKKFSTACFQLLLLGFSIVTIVLTAIYLYLSPNLSPIESIRDVRLQTPLRIYSADNKLIGEFGERRLSPVTLKDVPQTFVDALLAAEDDTFFSHKGVSLRGIARAVMELIKTGKKGSGGSTLTMQLTRNVFLKRDKQFSRKFREILMSLKLERELSKEEILELYVNYMFLGKRAYGIQAAAQVYYGKNLKQLDTAQLAMIAGLFQGPSTQNPIVNPTRAVERRNWILGRMLELKLLSEEHYQIATVQPVSASYHGSQLEANTPYVAELAREKTIRSFGLKAYTEGYRVYTTIDSRLQLSAQKAVVDGLLEYDQRKGYRGPERRFLRVENNQKEVMLTDDIEPQDTPITAGDRTQSERLETALAELAEIPNYGGLEPALIVNLGEKHFDMQLKSGENIVISWENGISSARPYIDENTRGPAPKTAADVAAVGDIVRVRLANDDVTWTLSQIPLAQSALVALNPYNGGIKALVGGFDFYASKFNRATQAYRQPGSSFKPFVYTKALEKGMTAATIENDAPIVFEDAALEATWRPENDGNTFLGPLRIRKALYLSRNLVSIRLLNKIGIPDLVDSLTRFGFDKARLPRDLSIALGSLSATPLEMATAWSSFANGGYKVDSHLIRNVKDFNGNIIYEAMPDTVCRKCKTEQIVVETNETPQEALLADDEFTFFDLPQSLKQALGLLEEEDYPRAAKIVDDRVTFIMDSMLRDVIRRGTGTKARVLKRDDLAGKTGTTNGPTDAWFSGYSNNVVTSTWVGFDKSELLGRREYGGSAALPIWINFMRDAIKGTDNTIRAQPPGIVTVKIDPSTGERARLDDPASITEIFRSEYAPTLKQTDEEDVRKSIEELEEIF